jgi:hypothetical protein
VAESAVCARADHVGALHVYGIVEKDRERGSEMDGCRRRPVAFGNW